MWELQLEDPLHQDLSVAVEVQGFRVADDLMVGVRVQQHRHVAAGGSHLQRHRGRWRPSQVKLS